LVADREDRVGARAYAARWRELIARDGHHRTRGSRCIRLLAAEAYEAIAAGDTLQGRLSESACREIEEARRERGEVGL
jgi:hypothetical protein